MEAPDERVDEHPNPRVSEASWLVPAAYRRSAGSSPAGACPRTGCRTRGRRDARDSPDPDHDLAPRRHRSRGGPLWHPCGPGDRALSRQHVDQPEKDYSPSLGRIHGKENDAFPWRFGRAGVDGLGVVLYDTPQEYRRPTDASPPYCPCVVGHYGGVMKADITVTGLANP